jgi:hypothetical protein
MRIPYGQLEAHPSTFIDPVYYPPTVTLKDPQNMRMDDIKAFLGYIQKREILHGQSEAFRFRKYKDKTGLQDAVYAVSAAVPAGDGSQSCHPIEYNPSDGMPGIPSDRGGMGTDATTASDPLTPVTFSWPPAAFSDTSAARPNILIDQAAMSVLTSMGVPASIPVNGPADGQPKYIMPQAGSGMLAEDNIDPRLLHISQSNPTSNH